MSGIPKIVSRATCKRKYTHGDPNWEMRPWLEHHVGKQFVDWDWEWLIMQVGDGPDMIQISFSSTESAVLFELSW